MAIPNKPSPKNPLNIQGTLPDPPKIPQSVVFKDESERQRWQIQQDAWWNEVKKRIQQMTELIQQEVNKIANST